MSNHTNDPRDATLETRVTFPKTWQQEDTDTLGSSNMFLSGLIMVTRNRMLSWPALFVGFTAFINQHPLRAKEGKQGYNGILLAVFAVLASYMPMILIMPNKKVTEQPLGSF